MSGEEEIIEIDMTELKKMKVPELKRKLGELGLPTKGTKAELLARVEKYLHEQEEIELLDEEVEGEVEGDVAEGGVAEEEEAQETSITEDSLIIPPAEEPPPEPKEIQKEETNPDPSIPVKKPLVSTSTSTTCQADRLAQRAARFGSNVSEEAKKTARAERFGIALENGTHKGLGKRPAPSEAELEKMKKRAERFGTSVSPAVVSVEEEEKKKKRLERFGQSATELSMEERKKQRAARFGTS